jgi:succinate dehydrogenase / fumarate reductase, flavoprotein subunit
MTDEQPTGQDKGPIDDVELSPSRRDPEDTEIRTGDPGAQVGEQLEPSNDVPNLLADQPGAAAADEAPSPPARESDPRLDARIPPGPVQEKWDTRRFDVRLVNPANKRKYSIIVVGSGLAGAAAAASFGELGYRVDCYCYQDSPRRAHSIAAQGGINAAKNYRNDGDSIYRLFYDTVKGGDFRAREANVYRLAQLSVNIIDQCVAQGVPFAREYGGLLDTRSFGGAQVSRTFYARGQTGQQLLLGAYQALERQIGLGSVRMHSRHEMLDLIVVDGAARGIVVRDMVTGELQAHTADAVVLATGGYGNVFYLSTNAKGCNTTAIWRAHRRGAYFGNPCFTQIHPTCIPVSGEHQSKLTLMSESLRNDGRVWVPVQKGDTRSPDQIPEADRDYYLERRYPSFGNLVPRDVASRAAKQVCDEGRGVGPGGLGVYLDFSDAIERLGVRAIRERYGNLFDMYERITGEDPYRVPMRIYPAVHYTMGGLWVDYDLMSTIPGLFVGGEANFSDHGANRLGASALMQGLADGYFVLPVTIGNYLASADRADEGALRSAADATLAEVRQRVHDLLAINGTRSPDSFHRELGRIMWEYCGMARNEAGLKTALDRIPKLREEFWSDLRVGGTDAELNQSLEKAGRVADFLELGELMCRDALHRTESCGGHFREESQTPEGEAQRDDDEFSYVAAWEWTGRPGEPALHKEYLTFDHVHPAQRSYK